MNLKSRLQKLEVKARGDVPPQVAEWIEAGMFFDDLSPAQQETYCQYRWDMVEPPDKHLADLWPELEYTAHFQLDRRPPPPTKAEFEERVREVQEYMQKACDEYNSPAAVARRKAEYEELQRIGDLRRQAFYSGRPMSDYPLPWEKDCNG